MLDATMEAIKNIPGPKLTRTRLIPDERFLMREGIVSQRDLPEPGKKSVRSVDAGRVSASECTFADICLKR